MAKYTVYDGKAIDQEIMDIIGSYMDDEIREDFHSMAPCEPEEFLAAYLDRDPDFRDLLEREFEFKEGDLA